VINGRRHWANLSVSLAAAFVRWSCCPPVSPLTSENEQLKRQREWDRIRRSTTIAVGPNGIDESESKYLARQTAPAHSPSHENTPLPVAHNSCLFSLPLFHALHLSTWHVIESDHAIHRVLHLRIYRDETSFNRCRTSRILTSATGWW